jgi:hypothetical protein
MNELKFRASILALNILAVIKGKQVAGDNFHNSLFSGWLWKPTPVCLKEVVCIQQSTIRNVPAFVRECDTPLSLMLLLSET